MKRKRNLILGMGIIGLGFTYAAMWVDEPLKDRLGGTGFLTIVIALIVWTTVAE